MKYIKLILISMILIFSASIAIAASLDLPASSTTGTNFYFGETKTNEAPGTGSPAIADFTTDTDNYSNVITYDDGAKEYQVGGGDATAQTAWNGENDIRERDGTFTIGANQATILAQQLSVEKARESKVSLTLHKTSTFSQDGVLNQSASIGHYAIKNNTLDGYLVYMTSSGAGHLVPHTAATAVPNNTANAGDIDLTDGETPIPYNLKISQISNLTNNMPSWVKTSIGIVGNTASTIEPADLASGKLLLISTASSEYNDSKITGKMTRNELTDLVAGVDYDEVTHSITEVNTSTGTPLARAALDQGVSDFTIDISYEIVDNDDYAKLQMAGKYAERIGLVYVDL
jgi:hypothetical protein